MGKVTSGFAESFFVFFILFYYLYTPCLRLFSLARLPFAFTNPTLHLMSSRSPPVPPLSPGPSPFITDAVCFKIGQLENELMQMVSCACCHPMCAFPFQHLAWANVSSERRGKCAGLLKPVSQISLPLSVPPSPLPVCRVIGSNSKRAHHTSLK